MTYKNDTVYPVTLDVHKEEGITKREYFAAMAMQGLISARAYDLCDIEYTAIDAVNMADALIKELNK